MNFPKSIFGGIAARLPFVCRTSIVRNNAIARPAAARAIALAVGLCALGLSCDAGPVKARSLAGSGATGLGGTNFFQLTNATYADGSFGISTNTTLQFHAIPEPQTWMTAFGGLGTLLALQRFRRTRS